jgi:hypothetical protein
MHPLIWMLITYGLFIILTGRARGAIRVRASSRVGSTHP